MATPTRIPVHSDRNQHKGVLGIMDNTRLRSTEFAAIYPPRGGVYARAVRVIEPRPFYFDEHGTFQYKVYCCHCGDYQRKEAFGPDSRKINGLRSWCRTCEAAYASDRRRVR